MTLFCCCTGRGGRQSGTRAGSVWYMYALSWEAVSNHSTKNLLVSDTLRWRCSKSKDFITIIHTELLYLKQYSLYLGLLYIKFVRLLPNHKSQITVTQISVFSFSCTTVAM